MNYLRTITSTLKLAAPPTPQVCTVRYRYHADKVKARAEGKLIKRFGYKEKILTSGLLPHNDKGYMDTIRTYKYAVNSKTPISNQIHTDPVINPFDPLQFKY